MDYRVGYKKNWTRDKDPGGGKIITEMHGYMPVQRRIEQIMDAGQRLIEARTAEAYYHFRTGEDPDLDFRDPTQAKGYDPADAVQDRYANEARLDASRKEYERRAEEAQKVVPVVPPEGGK